MILTLWWLYCDAIVSRNDFFASVCLSSLSEGERLRGLRVEVSERVSWFQGSSRLRML